MTRSPVVACYCATFLKPEMWHIYRQISALERVFTGVNIDPARIARRAALVARLDTFLEVFARVTELDEIIAGVGRRSLERWLGWYREAGLDGVLRQLTSVGVRSLTSQPPTLEELFLRHYEADGASADGQPRKEVAR